MLYQSKHLIIPQVAAIGRRLVKDHIFHAGLFQLILQPLKIPVSTGRLAIGNDNEGLFSVDYSRWGVDPSVQFIQFTSAKQCRSRQRKGKLTILSSK